MYTEDWVIQGTVTAITAIVLYVAWPWPPPEVVFPMALINLWVWRDVIGAGPKPFLPLTPVKLAVAFALSLVMTYTLMLQACVILRPGEPLQCLQPMVIYWTVGSWLTNLVFGAR